MKKLIFSALFAFGAFLTSNAQITIIVSNNTSGPYFYKTSDGDGNMLVNQTFGPGETAKFPVGHISLPLVWAAQNSQGCEVQGVFAVSMTESPDISSSDSGATTQTTTTSGCGATVSHEYVDQSGGGGIIFVDLQ